MALRQSSPERYPELLGMYVRGKANSLDLLKADFSQWPPNRLKIVRPPNIDITFKSAFTDSFGIKQALPRIKHLFWASQIAMHYPIIAGLYLGLSTFKKALKLVGFVKPSEPTIYINGLHRLFNYSLKRRRYLSHAISHEFKHVVQGRDAEESLTSSFSHDRLKVGKMVPESANQDLKYLLTEPEIQARMHTIIVGAYHQFERMPVTQNELFAVLISQGIAVPDNVRESLENTDSGREALMVFNSDDDLFDRYADRMAIRQLNVALTSVKPEEARRLWSHVLPFMYGDLIELYGDQKGMKRMGGTHNIQLREVFYKAVSEVDDARLHEEIDREVALELGQEPRTSNVVDIKSRLGIDAVEAMDNEDAVSLTELVLSGDPYRLFGRNYHVDVREPMVLEALRGVTQRPDLNDRERSQLTQAFSSFKSRQDSRSRASSPSRSGDRPFQMQMTG